MRKITQDAVKALINEEHFKKKNISVWVEYDIEKKVIYTSLFLSFSPIAKFIKKTGEMTITTAGFDFSSIKEIIRAIPGVRSLITHKGKLFLNDEEWDGEWKTL